MFWQQDVPSHISVDVINRCPSDKQVLPERNILCLKILEIALCGSWDGFALPSLPLHPITWSHHTGDSLELSATSPSVLSHHFWGLSDLETNWTGSRRGQRYTMTQTLLRSNYKVSTMIRTFSHENFSKASFPILFTLLASGHSATKKIRKKQTKTKLPCCGCWAERSSFIHNPTRQSTRTEEIIHSYPRSLIKVLPPPEPSALYLYMELR